MEVHQVISLLPISHIWIPPSCNSIHFFCESTQFTSVSLQIRIRWHHHPSKFIIRSATSCPDLFSPDPSYVGHDAAAPPPLSLPLFPRIQTHILYVVDTSSRSSCVSLAKEDCQEQSYIVLKIAHINMKVYPPFLSFLTIHSFLIILNSTSICNTEHLSMKWRFINSCQNSQEPIRIRSLGRVILFRFFCSFGTNWFLLQTINLQG
jgi:hypothetical protein